jgi:general secretion pathway protein H
LSRRAGFTLLELVVVLFILALITALVAPAFSRSFGQAQLKAATRDLAALFRFARTEAITSQGVLEVVLDRQTNSYWLRGIVQTSTGQGTEQPVQSRQARIRALPTGVTLKSVVIDTGPLREDERGSIIFFPHGSSTGGSIDLSDEKGRGYRILVDPTVGLVRVSTAENV